jgi:hypothetical protein
MVSHAECGDPAGITREQLIAWKNALLDEELNPLSIRYKRI